MSIRINSNIAALNAERRLGQSTAQLQQSYARLSSGLRINRAVDDAAGLAISASLNADSRVLGIGVRNINDGISAIAIAAGALDELKNIAIRQKELAEQAANGIYSSSQRTALNSEANALVAEFNRIVTTTSFNGRNLLDQSFTDVTLQFGYGTNAQLDVSIGSELARLAGDGTFGSATNYNAEAPTRIIGTMDLNGDGIEDIYDLTNALGVALGNGDGTFKARRTFVPGNNNSPVSIEFGDFNGDSAMDYIVGRGTGVAWIGLGVGDGSFKAAMSVPTPNAAFGGIGVGDFNEDGKLDFANAGGSTNYFFGNGDGTFNIGISFTSGSTSDTEFVDINGDNHLDIIAYTSSGGAPGLEIALGNGNGTFKHHVHYAFGSATQTSRALTMDVNNDGVLDIALSNNGQGLGAVFLGNGNGTFRIGSTFALAGLFSITSGDYNSDGFEDLAYSNTAAGGVYILAGNGNGSFKAAVSYAAGSNSIHVSSFDYNDDGILDLLLANNAASAFNLLLGNGTASSTIDELDLTTQSSALDALETTTETLERVTKELGRLGAYESRLTSAAQVLAATRENYMAASAQISDVDVAFEAANLVRARILQQAGAAVLAQANNQPALALKLLSDV